MSFGRNSQCSAPDTIVQYSLYGAGGGGGEGTRGDMGGCGGDSAGGGGDGEGGGGGGGIGKLPGLVVAQMVQPPYVTLESVYQSKVEPAGMNTLIGAHDPVYRVPLIVRWSQ